MRKGAAAEDSFLSTVSSRRSWRVAVILAVLALAWGILLVGVSVWFLGAVALAGGTAAALTFNFHHPAALIRFLAIARTAGKYGERVAGHRAALYDQVNRRARLFRAMSRDPEVRQAGWQLAREDRLTDYIEDVEDLDYRRLRSDMPAAIMLLAACALLIATLWLLPLAALIPIAAMLVLYFALYRLVPVISRFAGTIRMDRRMAGGRIGAVLSAVTPLTAEGEWAERLDWAFAPLSDAVRVEYSQARALATIDNAFVIAGLLTGFAVMLAAWLTGLRGPDLLPAGFLAFCWIALADQGHNLSKICLGRVRAAAAGRYLSRCDDAAYTDDKGRQDVHLHSVSTLIIVDLPFASPDGRPLGGRLTGEVSAGHPAVISGPSGCGKTTLLKTIAGWLEYGGQGDILFDGASAGMALRRRSVHLGLHDAAILYDTVHENLFAPDASEDELWRALDAVELSDRIRQAGGLEGWIAQTDFSLGEAHRLSLARAWLSPLPVILIDEPEAHLDREQAARIMDRLHKRFADQVFIYSSHNRESGEEQLLLTIASSG